MKKHLTRLLLLFCVWGSLFVFSSCGNPCKDGHNFEKGEHYVYCGYHGHTEYVCSVCGEVKTVVDSEITPHAYEEIEHITGNCMSPDKTKYECAVCHYKTMVEGEEYGPHNYATEYTVDIPATTKNPGEKSQHCQNEGCNGRINITVIPQVEADFPNTPF